MTLEKLKQQLIQNPNAIDFHQVIELINNIYDYTPTRFSNGLNEDVVINEAGSNEGSCRLLAFALEQQLTKEQTLACFGAFYRNDVLKHPEGSDHANIRTFMKHGWQGIQFDSHALTAKTS